MGLSCWKDVVMYCCMTRCCWIGLGWKGVVLFYGKTNNQLSSAIGFKRMSNKQNCSKDFRENYDKANDQAKLLATLK